MECKDCAYDEVCFTILKNYHKMFRTCQQGRKKNERKVIVGVDTAVPPK
jgi:hypothetical protein